MTAVRALIFDCDGTLADTMPLHFEAWQIICRRHRFEFPEERFYALGGVPSRDIIRMLGSEQNRHDLDPLRIAKEKEAEYLTRLPRVGPVRPVVDIALRHRGQIPMAVASGGSRDAIETVLQHLKIRDWFQTVVTNEDVTRQKPAPDIFLEAARRLGVNPVECRAFEDTDLGLTAIRAAGMDAVDIRSLLV